VATAQGAINRTQTDEDRGTQPARRSDAAESLLKTVDESIKGATKTSLFHILTLGSIGASIALFLAGKKQAGIFIGLWPPTFQALKAVVDRGQQGSSNRV